MTASAPNSVKAIMLLGLVIAAMGVYVASAGDAPGAAVLGFVLMLVAIGLGVRAIRNRLSTRVWRAAIAIGVIVAGLAAFLTHGVSITAPLFAQAPDVPSSSEATSSPEWATAIERAQAAARAAVIAQNLPGLSVAVGTGVDVIWAEGFGWRDVVTRTPVTPATRFNIGTAAQVITPAGATSLGLRQTGTDPATAWSPEHVGEPEEDFPGFTAIHDLILRPIGISAPRQPLPDDRATFYVPATFWHDVTTDPRRGRRLMYMRDLACCADGLAFASTPSDVVRFALATHAGSVDGDLAGGRVMSLLTRPDSGVVVAVMSNIAFAHTTELVRQIADDFATPR